MVQSIRLNHLWLGIARLDQSIRNRGCRGTATYPIRYRGLGVYGTQLMKALFISGFACRRQPWNSSGLPLDYQQAIPPSLQPAEGLPRSSEQSRRPH